MPTVAGEPLAVRAGQRVRLEGRVVPARGFSGREVRATVLATEAWPAPRPLPVDPMDATGLDAAWVVAEGSVVRQLESDATHVQYDLLSGGRRLRVRLLVDPAEPIPNLLEKRVRVRAVHVPQRNPAGRVVRTDLWVPRRQDIAVLGAVGEDERFKLPRTMLDQLREAVGRDWVRVAGTVKAWQEGEAVTLRDETGELTVVTAQPGPLAPGTAVELVGRPQEVEGGVVLKAPFLRPVATWPARTLTAPRQAGGVVAPLKLRVAAQVLELEPAEAARGYPVALRGVVTWSHAAADFYFVQDSTGGVRVRVAEGITPPPPGTPVSVEGVTVLGAFAPELRGTGIAGANPINAPAPREVSLEHALTGSEEARLVTLRGYVRAVVPERAWRRLELATAAGEFEAWAPAGDDDRALIGALVRVTGVCEAEADGRRQLTGIRLWVPDAEAVRVEAAPSADPFAAPLRAVAGLRQFNPLQTGNQWVRVRGTVVAQEAGRFLCLQEGEAGVMVLSRDGAEVPVGGRLEVVGLPGREGGRIVLREGVWRAAQVAEAAPEPLELARPEELLPAADARLVRVRATLLNLQPAEEGQRLSLQAGGRVFSALLPEPGHWAPDSRLELTGVYLLEFDEYRRPRGFVLRLRSAADVAVLEAPSWWTAPRLVAVVAGLAACVGLGLVWVAALRRRVQAQTAQIREQAERELRLQVELEKTSRLESLGVLAGGIAHDFNNLLTAIVGNLGLLATDERVMAAAGEEVRSAQRAARRAGDITQQLLTFAKGGSPVRQAVALPELVREAADFALHGAKVRAEFDFARELPAAEVDPAQFARVIHNLVLNAVQAMPEGGIVRLALRAVEVAAGELGALKAGPYLELAVADTGVGIAPEALGRVFEPYFSTKRGNSGLGLAAVRSIVTKHDGHIAVASMPGVGTTFRLWLPASAKPVMAVAAAEEERPEAVRPRLRVLLMDDEEFIRDLGVRALAHGGHEVTTVADGKAAVAAYAVAGEAGRPFDVVVLDLTVPGGMGGEETVRELLRMDPGARVIVSSGYSSNPVMARYREHGFCAVVPKPYEIGVLLRTVESVARG
jgi:signal transduction histidine kinase/CheY-like chemotaxis protein/uncharacterized protein YdeI (BOF family)